MSDSQIFGVRNFKPISDVKTPKTSTSASTGKLYLWGNNVSDFLSFHLSVCDILFL